MRTIITSLLTAAAMLPGIAQAQEDRGNWQERRAEMRTQRQETRQEARQQPGDAGQQPPQFDRRGGGDRPPRSADNGNWQRPDRPAFQQVEAPRPQPAQADPRPGTRPDWRGNRDDNQGWRGDRNGARPGGPDDRGGGTRWQSGRDDIRPDRPNGGDRSRFDADRRRDEARRQFQRNGNDWNDGFRNDNRFADRNGWNNRGWNRGWRSDNRYNWSQWRGADRNRFRLPRYYAPYGWDRGYRRFSVGVTLSSVLFGQNYWIDDAYDYRLPPAYGPYRWVRYYNDALLVDVRYGTVVDTVYDIFW